MPAPPVIDALNVAAASMAADLARLNTISQNLANATTPAYKREIPSFGHVLGAAVPTSTFIVDHRHGTVRYTGNALDFAIDGDGFFEVQTEAGMAYTRRGDFHIDALGRLVTQAGHPVQGMGGALHPSTVQPGVDREGRLMDGDKVLGRLKLVHFPDPSQLERIEGGLFRAVQPKHAESEAQVRQGHLEASNVNTAAEMVRLIETMRRFEATQKVVQGVDEAIEQALRKLGEF
jgi:flagellar basal body rod protein FlgG